MHLMFYRIQRYQLTDLHKNIERISMGDTNLEILSFFDFIITTRM